MFSVETAPGGEGAAEFSDLTRRDLRALSKFFLRPQYQSNMGFGIGKAQECHAVCFETFSVQEASGHLLPWGLVPGWGSMFLQSG